MKRIISIAIMSLFVLFSYSQQRIQLNNQFTSLELIGKMDVELISDTVCQIEATAYGFDIQQVKWTQKGGLFSLSMPSGFLESGRLEIKIRVNDLINLICDGCVIKTSGKLSGKVLNVYSLSANNQLLLNLDIAKLSIEAAGKSKIELSGDIEWADLKVQVGASVDASKAKIGSCNVFVSGGATVTVNVIEKLNARANTKGVVYYLGNPQTHIKTATWGEVLTVPVID